MNTSETEECTRADDWQGDVLSRKQHADYLYNVLVRMYETHHRGPASGALTIAVDADWGAGKTFFINRWCEDLQAHGHPVIKFDAWENDLQDDPLVGLMSSIQKGLNSYLNIQEKTKKKSHAIVTNFIKQAGKAVLPTATIVLEGVLRKYTGLAVDEIAAAVTTGEVEHESTPKADEITAKALERFFSESLKNHSARQEAIATLKKTATDLLEFLEKEKNARLPLFVFIDELDRCRPDYAIRLLEGAKHLFDANGICFVFSTTLTQLAASVRAIYGTSFDGRRYLKRFFSLEFLLPEPELNSFALYLSKNSILLEQGFAVHTALPQGGQPNEEAFTLAINFAAIARAFQLDLRSQIQVFRAAEMAALQIDRGSSLHCFYLFGLAAMLHKGVENFRMFIDNGKPDFGRTEQAARTNEIIQYTVRVPNDGFGYTEDHRKQNVFDLLTKFRDASKQTNSQRIGHINSQTHEYPGSAFRPLNNDATTAYNNQKGDHPISISRYHRMVLGAAPLI